MTLGQKIKQIRKGRKITQKQLATQIGRSFSSIQKYEMDLAIPPIDTLKKIASTLDVTVDYLTGMTNDPHTRIGTQEDIDRYFGGGSFSTKDGVLITATIDGALTHYFNLLNNEGKFVAVERVKELTEIPRYQLQPAPPEGKDPTQD